MTDAGQPSVAPVAAPAGIPHRVIAYLVDVIVVSVVVYVTAAVLSHIIGPALQFDLGNADPSARIQAAPGIAAIQSALATLISGVYFVASWRWMGATPGQHLFRLRVVSNASPAAPVPIGAGLLRWIVLIPPFGLGAVLVADVRGAAFALPALGLLWAWGLLISTLRREDRRGLHDRASGSAVVRGERRSVAAPPLRAG